MSFARSCHITSAHPPFDPRIFHKECISLAEAGYDVSVLCPHDRHETRKNIRIVPVGRRGGRLRRFSVLPWRIAWTALREGADVYHFHDPDLVPVGLFLKVLGQKHVVYDVHEDSSETVLSRQWIPKWGRRALSTLINVFEKLSARAFDCVVTATPHLSRRFEGCAHVIDVRNYPRFDEVPQWRPNIADAARPRLIYVGGLEDVRGTREIVRALGLLKHGPVTLELVGSFTEEAFEAELAGLPEWKHVEYLGQMPYEAVPKRLGGASIGLVCLHPLPRFLVSHPLKLFEYMAAGIPVIASDFPIWRDIINEARCGLVVDPSDPGAIAQAIDSLLDDAALARRMGAAGRAFAEAQYNWKLEEEKLLIAYDEILGQVGGRPRPAS